MSDVAWVVLVVLLGWASGWVGMWVALARWERRQPAWRGPEVAPVVERAPEPKPAPERRADPEPPRPRKPTLCRLESERGGECGRVMVAVRRPSLRVPGPSGVAVYVASHQDGAEWVYRRVGVERN